MGDDRAICYTEGPNLIYRASGFGHCIRQHVLARQSYDPAPWRAGIQRAFDAGNTYEDRLVAHLRRADIPNDYLTAWSLYGQQREYDLELLPGKIIRVHIDALGKRFPKVLEPTEPFGYVVEFKSFGDKLMALWGKSYLDEMPAYAYQISIEMLATGLPCLVVVADKEKSTDTNLVATYRLYKTPPVSKAQLIRRLVAIDKSVSANQLPPCEEEGGFCPYYNYHDAKPLGTELDNQLQQFVRRYRMLGVDIALLKKEQDEAKKVLADALTTDTDYSVDDKSIGFYTSYRKKIDTDALIEAAVAQGIDASQYISEVPSISIRSGK